MSDDIRKKKEEATEAYYNREYVGPYVEGTIHRCLRYYLGAAQHPLYLDMEEEIIGAVHVAVTKAYVAGHFDGGHEQFVASQPVANAWLGAMLTGALIPNPDKEVREYGAGVVERILGAETEEAT